MTFILSEDEALRDRLKGMTVSDNETNTRPVGVWFGQPDLETRDQAFPFITIDLIQISEARERVHSQFNVTPWYYEVDLSWVAEEPDGWTMPYPIPINLDYQITTFARHPRHDRQLLGQILGQRLPFRFGSIGVTEKTEVVGPDTTLHQTVRRLDMLGHAKRDTTESGKRMFMNMFTVRISSEIPSPYALKYYYAVSQIQLTEKAAPYPATLTDPSLITTTTISV